jgi:methyl-accepting chemotaxis protein
MTGPKATDEIRSQIGAIQAETRQAVGSVGGLSQTIADLGAITVAVASAVEQQGAATAEIARSGRRAAEGSETIGCNLSARGQASSDTGSAAGAGQSASGRLSADCEKMAGSVKGFVAHLGAA